MKPATFDVMLRSAPHVARALAGIARELEISRALFPPTKPKRQPLTGRALRRYRGEHRPTASSWSPAELAAERERRRQAERIDHLRALRRPAKPAVPLFLGTKFVDVKFYPVPADWGDPSKMTGTLTLLPDDDALMIPLVKGPPGYGSSNDPLADYVRSLGDDIGIRARRLLPGECPECRWDTDSYGHRVLCEGME